MKKSFRLANKPSVKAINFHDVYDSNTNELISRCFTKESAMNFIKNSGCSERYIIIKTHAFVDSIPKDIKMVKARKRKDR